MKLIAMSINTLTGDCANNVQKERKLYEFEIVEVFIDLHYGSYPIPHNILVRAC